jgi:hypothetical protein
MNKCSLKVNYRAFLSESILIASQKSFFWSKANSCTKCVLQKMLFGESWSFLFGSFFCLAPSVSAVRMDANSIMDKS